MDDAPIYRETLERLLRTRFELKILHASNSLEGFRVLEANPDVVVVVADLRMPGPDGLTFLTAVRDSWPAMHRILLTGYSTSQHVLSGVADLVFDKSMDCWLIADTIGQLAYAR